MPRGDALQSHRAVNGRLVYDPEGNLRLFQLDGGARSVGVVILAACTVAQRTDAYGTRRDKREEAALPKAASGSAPAPPRTTVLAALQRFIANFVTYCNYEVGASRPPVCVAPPPPPPPK
jgi:hypothetical protein